MVTINIRKKDIFLVAAVIAFFIAISIVFASWPSDKKMFHSADDIKVNIAGDGDYTLQEAIALGKIGGGSSANIEIGVSNPTTKNPNDVANQKYVGKSRNCVAFLSQLYHATNDACGYLSFPCLYDSGTGRIIGSHTANGCSTVICGYICSD